MYLKNVFLQFINHHCDDKPLLLGLSGGPDSTALFYLLLECDRPFQVAHIDHGWRPESGKEALYLAELSKSHGIPYYLQRLSPKESPGNLENNARRMRLVFFRELCHKHKLQGVVLGHHADDQAETVLKRIFEGATLPKLKGLGPKTLVEGVTLFRPLLKVFKKEILTWLNDRKVHYFNDQTNRDTRFLRGRMRTELLPALSQSFGKTISRSLCRIGDAAAELREFLETLLEPYRERVVRKEGETVLDLNPHWPKSPFLLKAIIRDLFDREQMALSNSVLTTIILHLEKRRGRTSIQVGKRKVILGQGVIVLKKPLSTLVSNK